MPNCARCGKPFAAVRSDAKYCSSTCRSAKFRAGPDPDVPPPVPDVVDVLGIPGGLAASVRTELADAGVLDTVAGQAALLLAQMAENPTMTDGPRVTAARQVAAAVALAKSQATKGKSKLDEIGARRDAKLAAGDS